jgi:hypothetical protein
MTATVATSNTVRTSSNNNASRTAVTEQPRTQPQQSRPSFLTVLLRALAASAM